MMTIEEFCDRHRACEEGRNWALANCNTLLDAWKTARFDWLIWMATRTGVLPDSELRMFAVRCARSVQHLMTDPRSFAALDVAERHARGNASDDELKAAEAAAGAAAGAAWADGAAAWAAGAAARAAGAAGAAAWAAGAAAGAAAWAAGAAAWAAAGEAARAAGEAARDGFADDIRRLTPNFN